MLKTKMSNSALLKSTLIMVMLIILVAVLVACGSASEPAPTPTVTPTSIPTVTPTPLPTPIPSPTLTFLETTGGATACESAFSSPAIPGVPIAPIYTLLSKEYEDGKWTHPTRPVQFEASSASEVQTLVCIKESRIEKGRYSDLQTAYSLFWDVRLVQWPDGISIGGVKFSGDDPPSIKSGTGPGYGDVPFDDFSKWLTAVFGDNILLVSPFNVSSSAFSSDGRTLALGGPNETVLLWDMSTKKAINTILETRSALWISSMAFSPDGQMLAATGGDIVVWQIATGQKVQSFLYLANPMSNLAFSPNGKMLASGNSTNMIVWDISSGEEILDIYQGSFVFSLAFSPDGKILASGNEQGEVKLWDIASQQEIYAFRHTSAVWSLAFSPDGKILAAGDSNKTVYEMVDGKDMKFGGIAVAKDFSMRLTSEPSEGTIILWDMATKQRIQTFKHASAVWSLAFSPDGKILASGNDDGTITLMETATGEEELVPKLHSAAVWNLAFSSDGKMVISGSRDGTVKFHEIP